MSYQAKGGKSVGKNMQLTTLKLIQSIIVEDTPMVMVYILSSITRDRKVGSFATNSWANAGTWV